MPSNTGPKSRRNTKSASPLDGIEDEEMADLQARPELNDRERRFIMSWLQHHNLCRAVREAGFDAATLTTQHHMAKRIMERPHVRAVIEERQQMRLERLKVDAPRIEEELARVAFANIGRMIRVSPDAKTLSYDFTDADVDDFAAINGVKIKMDADGAVIEMEIKRDSKLDALGKLAQIHKMIQGDGVQVNVDMADELRNARKRAGLAEADE